MPLSSPEVVVFICFPDIPSVVLLKAYRERVVLLIYMFLKQFQHELVLLDCLLAIFFSQLTTKTRLVYTKLPA